MLSSDQGGHARESSERAGVGEAQVVAEAALAASASAAAQPLRRGDRSGRRGAIHFVDPDGASWYCHERSALHDPGARGPTCLVFDCGEVLRRVWTYPADWRELPAAALLALSWRT